MSRKIRWMLSSLFFLLALEMPVLGGGPRDNVPDQVRPVPPIGIEVSGKDRRELQEGMARLEDSIARLRKNNARQVPKLPDWAVIDLRTPPDSLWPGRIVGADFFDERWKIK